MLLWYNSALLVAFVLASIDIQRGGWLDRVIEYHKQKFFNEIVEVAPIQIYATIQRAPPGYTDSKEWTIDSVMHLLMLISESERARPVKIALRRMLNPTRRLSISKQKSFKLFPSLSKNIHNYMYYEVNTDEDYSEADPLYTDVPDDDAVVMVSNPVEARLPSARISVRLLRDILDARAQAARVMPSTTRQTFPWVPMNTTKAAVVNSTSADTGAAEGGTAADSNSTAAAAAATTAAAAAAE